MTSLQDILTVDAGMLVRGMLRQELVRLRFVGHKIDWIEGRGFLETRFTIRGEPAAILYIETQIKAWDAAGDAPP